MAPKRSYYERAGKEKVAKRKKLEREASLAASAKGCASLPEMWGGTKRIKTAIRSSMDSHSDEPVFLNILMRLKANGDLMKRSMYPCVVRKF